MIPRADQLCAHRCAARVPGVSYLLDRFVHPHLLRPDELCVDPPTRPVSVRRTCGEQLIVGVRDDVAPVPA